jgi:catechol 2,3-dioxygenase-like lactoylglutathione lyase family enzyme
MKTRGIDHLNIRVRNLERSRKFYCEVLGMEEAFREPPRAIFLRCGKDLLTLAKTKRRIRLGMHFGFQTRTSGEVDRWVKWLKRNHVALTSEREEESGRGVYFRDPHGYLIEIYYEKS